MKHSKYTVCLIASVLLAGCAGTAPTTASTSVVSVSSPITVTPSSSPSSINKAVLALQNLLTIAENSATVYSALPTCTSTSGPVCSVPLNVIKIQAADNAAFAALQVAKATNAAADFTTLVTAYAAFTNAVATFGAHK